MKEIETTVEELLNIFEKQKSGVKKLLEGSLQQQVELFCTKGNIYGIRKRQWALFIEDIKDRKGNSFENAYAKYDENKDVIIITDELYKNLFLSFTLLEYEFDRAFWMAQLALIFCITHELTHLYAGHCQLCKDNKLGIIYNSKTKISYLEHQAMEKEADYIASCRVADLVGETLRSGAYTTVFNYKNRETFYNDAIRAICIFFYYVKNIGKEKNININTITHPPSFFRCCWSVIGFMTHYGTFFENDKTDIFLNSFFKNIMDKETIYGEPLLGEIFNFNILIKYTDLLDNVWAEKLKKKVMATRRLPYLDDFLSHYKVTFEDYVYKKL